MKKTLIFVAVIGIFALALGVAGFAYAQDDDPDTKPWGGRGGHGQGMMGHWGDDGDGKTGPMYEAMQTAIAEALGLTVEELDVARDEGKTPWDIAEEQGLSEDEFSTLMFDARNTALEQAVADGSITQEQADWIQSRWDDMKENGFGPGSCGGDGDGHHGGHGRGGRWSSESDGE